MIWRAASPNTFSRQQATDSVSADGASPGAGLASPGGPPAAGSPNSADLGSNLLPATDATTEDAGGGGGDAGDGESSGDKEKSEGPGEGSDDATTKDAETKATTSGNGPGEGPDAKDDGANEPGSAPAGGGAPPQEGGTTPPPEGSPVPGSQTATSQGPASNATQPNSDSPTKTGNVTAAFQAFKLLRLVEGGDADSSFKTDTIFENGMPAGVFANNPNTSDISTIGTDYDDSTWFSDGPYADRISFRFTYTPGLRDYAIAEPEVKVSSVSGVSPLVERFSTKLEDGLGSFYILYECASRGPEKNLIAIHIKVTEEHSVDMIWRKSCGRGRNEHIDFGFIDANNRLNLFNPDGSYGTDEQRTLVIGPLQQSTELRAQLTNPQWNLAFQDPYLYSDNPDVMVSLRTTLSGGTLTSDEETKFAVLYSTCEATNAKASIRFTFAIPPWDNVTATWQKVCGGMQSQALLIGTTGAGSFDVMKEGELDAQYNVTDSTEISSAFGRIREVDEKSHSQRFYLTNSDDESEIQIQTIATTMSDQEVLSTYVETPFAVSGSYIPSGGASIARHETKSLKLHFICKKRGESLVLVTLPIVKYKNVEFGFIKRCSEPTAYHHSGFLQTAGSILWTIMLLCVVGGIGTWVYIRRRSGVKYAPVATNERAP